MKLLIAGLFAFTGAAFAANIAPVSYHDGTLISLPSQTSCSEQTCGDDYQALYLVRSEGILYTLTPASGAGWSKAFSKTSSLDHAQPGTPLLLRDDGKHLFVKVGNRESMYTAVEAR